MTIPLLPYRQRRHVLHRPDRRGEVRVEAVISATIARARLAGATPGLAVLSRDVVQ
jgi:hypothetical protein